MPTAAEQKAAEQAKADKFVALATARTGKALKAMRQIGNLSNKRSYSYTDEQVQKILGALAEEVKTLQGQFSSGAPAKDEFTL